MERISAIDFVQHASEEFYTQSLLNKSLAGMDGFIPVTRRILYTLYSMPFGEYKTPELIARTMAIHPHGDSSIESAVASLAHPWRYPILPIDFIGNSGTLVTPAAAARYTSISGDCYVGRFIKKYLDFVPKYVGESHNEEAEFIPMPYPALLTSGFSQAPGAGISSSFLNHSFESVMEMADIMVDNYDENSHDTFYDFRLEPYYYGTGQVMSSLDPFADRGIAEYWGDYEVIKLSPRKFKFIMKSSMGRISSEKVYDILQKEYPKTYLGHMNKTSSNGLFIEILFATNGELSYDAVIKQLINKLKINKVLNIKQVALWDGVPAQVSHYNIMRDWVEKTTGLMLNSFETSLDDTLRLQFETKLKLFVARNTDEVVQENKTGSYASVAEHMEVENDIVASIVRDIRFGSLDESKLLKAAKDLVSKEKDLKTKIKLGVKNMKPLIKENLEEFHAV